LSLLLVARAPGSAASQPVPVHQEPLHRLLLDSIRFKVMDVHIPAGDTTRFHTHDAPAPYVAIHVSPTDAQVLGGSWQGVLPGADPRWKPGDVDIDSAYAVRPVTHRVTNVGSTPFRLILVTNAAPAGHEEANWRREIPGTPGIVSTWFRQTRVRLGPAEATGWSTSTTPVLIVHPGAGRIEVQIGSSKPQAVTSPGDWIMVPAGSAYRVTNTSHAPATAVAVQIR
jgi:quercetin dioxygenase-like cupin family protein